MVNEAKREILTLPEQTVSLVCWKVKCLTKFRKFLHCFEILVRKGIAILALKYKIATDSFISTSYFDLYLKIHETLHFRLYHICHHNNFNKKTMYPKLPWIFLMPNSFIFVHSQLHTRQLASLHW